MSDTTPITNNEGTTFADVDNRIHAYLEARDWLYNSPRSVAISIALEATELLEHYQWSEKPVGDTQALGEELADVLIYCFQFAHIQGIDLASAIEQKLQKAAKKFPAEAFKGKSGDQLADAWKTAKLNYKKEGL
ncbi:MAG TPA: nucleotide pyrophosphohydrolase [Candidatus Saccharimonadales bacterium]|nr:nucleotide pyrophosphohydrolase [Candidatus Saccharimonadales bacterium]